MKLNGAIGPAYTLPSVNIDCQRLVNLFPEVIESGSGKDGANVYYKQTPALVDLGTYGDGPIRLIHVDGLERSDGSYFQANRIFVVSAEKVYVSTFIDNVWTTTLLGSLNTYSGPVSAASISVDYGATVFVDGSNENYVYHKTTPSLETFSNFTDAGYVPIERASQVKWLDGYIVFIIKDSGTFYVTEWNSLNIDPLSFASAEGDPDNIIAVESNHKDLWLLNSRSVEIWANTGNADFPFERMPGGFIENGCLAPFSVAKISGTVVWLGRDANGQGVIFAAVGAQHERISTHAIEYAIQGYANPEEARAYAYQDAGHIFYVINFDEATWCYDFMTKMWHERCYTNPLASLERHRAQCHAYFPSYGKHILGDYETGAIYEFSNTVYLDSGDAITRLRAFPHIGGDLKEIFYKSLEIDLETGVGLDGATTQEGYDPQIMLQWSDDGGHTWSNEYWVSFGRLGEYKTRAKWRRLGRARDRVFRFTITAPVKVNILGASFEAELGNR